MSTVKDAIGQATDCWVTRSRRCRTRSTTHPELGYQEVQGVRMARDFLGRHGLQGRERACGGVDTAFRATLETGTGPTIAILCEYDALPGIGHACGHNVIAMSGAGAGAALAAVRSQLPAGRILVIGTPAEEGGGGKIKLIRGGVFSDVDCAMMIHGFDRTLLHQDLLGIVRVTFEFTGKAAHASADPWEGVNALDACHPDLQQREHAAPAGAAGRAHPRHRHERRARRQHHPRVAAAATFYVRAASASTTMWAALRRVIACAEGAARPRASS